MSEAWQIAIFTIGTGSVCGILGYLCRGFIDSKKENGKLIFNIIKIRYLESEKNDLNLSTKFNRSTQPYFLYDQLCYPHKLYSDIPLIILQINLDIRNTGKNDKILTNFKYLNPLRKMSTIEMFVGNKAAEDINIKSNGKEDILLNVILDTYEKIKNNGLTIYYKDFKLRDRKLYIHKDLFKVR